MAKTTAERFWAKVQIGPPDECWEWQGARNRKGYGNFVLPDHQTIGAHRYVTGCNLGDGVVVRHLCDNPPCVNPGHLRTGSLADNARDMMQKGRARGQFKPIFDGRLVAEVREMYETGHYSQEQVAQAVGMSQSNVSLIVRHLTRNSA